MWVRRKSDAKTALYVSMRRSGFEGVELDIEESYELRLEFLGVRPPWLEAMVRSDERQMADSWPTMEVSTENPPYQKFDNFHLVDATSLPEWGAEFKLFFDPAADDVTPCVLTEASLPMGWDAPDDNFFENILRASFIERSLSHLRWVR